MADKILNTRILMKVDTLENWSTSTLKLKNGELAFATVAASAGTGLSEPVVMVKIGTAEEKTFGELPWAFHAKASDVLAACKTEAGLKAFVNGVIADAGIASSSAMEALAGRVATVENDLNTETTGLKARMTTAEGAIDAVEALVGDKAVATQISEAIAALNLGTTYAAKALETTVATHIADTVAHVTADDKIKWNNALQTTDVVSGSANGTISVKGSDVAVKGLGSAAYTEAAAYDAAGSAAAAEAAAKAYADGLAGNYDAKGAAATAESNAKTYAKEYADGLAGNYDAAGSAAAAETAAKKHADDELTRLVGDKTVGTQITEAITGLDLGNTYAAKAHTHVKADITDFAHTHVASEITDLDATIKGYDYATKTEAKGYADGKDEAITAAQSAADQAQEEVDALETYVGTIPEGYTESSVVAYINKKAEETLAAASGNSTETAASVKAALDTYKIENNAAVQANADAIAELEELVGDEKVSDAIAAAVEVEKERAEGIEGDLETRLAAVEGDYLKVADKTELEGKITTNANAIERLTNGVSAEEVDGVNDLIQYVKDHGTEVTGIKNDIKANSEAIDAIEADYLKAADKTELSGLITGLDTRMGAAETAIGAKAAQTDLEALAGRVTTVEGDLNTATTGLKARMAQAEADIDALEDLVGGETVSKQIEDAIAGANLGQYALASDLDTAEGKIEDLEADSHTHSNKTELDKIADGDKAVWDAKVDGVTAAADSGLKATRTGNAVAIEIDESVTFIFDCGNSAE